MMQFIYLKVSGGQESAYTSLTELLRSEQIGHVYHSARKILIKGEKFYFNHITVSKVKLNHFTNGKRFNGNHRRSVGDSNRSPIEG